MQRCLQLAASGLGTTRPNPSVGCVIVHKDRIIGEGFTSPYGGAHAEVNAIESVVDKSLLKQAKLYVTLEPCSHHGKTPPCSDLIIEYRIPEVFIGTTDTSSKVAGKGIEKLKESGCRVTKGILEKECKVHHKRFLTYHDKKRPYIILKWAQSQDGFIAPKTKQLNRPVWITNEYSRQLVHKWRTMEHAILVGTNTVKEDNPYLTARHWQGQNPIRVVLDKKKTLSKDHNVFDKNAETLLIAASAIDFNRSIAIQICEVLFNNKIQSIIIEGGLKTLQTFIDEGLWDEARVFTGDKNLNEGISKPHFSGRLISEEHFMNDTLRIYHNIF
ncbi:MAG: bifunctional diaminohydroxyphosphoribosylaminopyrimidine deaminase/5-amino-6-(5-phosphoribosylamino)uracil reductase RibD [Flavobacteriaceae bacterium]|nr:bifunctional diaminohydroxyphosphoribosylaminopyrimidine deaminase/5-amino-6-(5-phosphoribosylamino)uracil reductase RibD [Bacteroidia bacterium]NND12301.1 bifunctional diaminohydroxyphosphoribosylaminopyrimidine deaminase/5-amino-6-(5-phosphoribosylamino)uracil reductase RibD [Flavobacteriaceae bacterium]NNK28146.1 bifunctional diaminohydroxyphosphoribosylaminopyrimidine deaminase/5-amino-6-(5-phosphoribosylamino)uracil reductase RibD [Flavobacteriaceae bacterium]NNL61263.1 bifunctional diam